MNADAEKECGRLSGDLAVKKELIAAMQWAYADAARICEELPAISIDKATGRNVCAEAIRERAK